MHVLVCAGPPLSGKSTFAKALAAKEDWTHIEVDSVLSLLMPSSNRCLEHRKLGYRAAHKLVTVLVGFGQNVVIDCTYSRVFYRQDLASALGQAESSLYLAEFHVGRDSALARFENRRDHPAIDLTEARVADLVAAYPYFDTGLSIDLSVTDIEEAVEDISRCIPAADPLDVGSWISCGLPDSVD